MTRCSPLKKGPAKFVQVCIVYILKTLIKIIYIQTQNKNILSPKQLHTVIKDVRMKIDVMPIHASSL